MWWYDTQFESVIGANVYYNLKSLYVQIQKYERPNKDVKYPAQQKAWGFNQILKTDRQSFKYLKTYDVQYNLSVQL